MTAWTGFYSLRIGSSARQILITTKTNDIMTELQYFTDARFTTTLYEI
jgi:hypothetical protein